MSSHTSELNSCFCFDKSNVSHFQKISVFDNIKCVSMRINVPSGIKNEVI